MSLFLLNRVLVPIDFSEASFIALEKTLASVEHPSQIHVLHVLSPIPPGSPGVIWETVNDSTRKRNAEKAFQERFSGNDYEGINFKVIIGDPSAEIIDYAQKQDIKLIVIPAHGSTGLNRFLMGSVAERVIRFAHCPVLVLRRS